MREVATHGCTRFFLFLSMYPISIYKYKCTYTESLFNSDCLLLCYDHAAGDSFTNMSCSTDPKPLQLYALVSSMERYSNHILNLPSTLICAQARLASRQNISRHSGTLCKQTKYFPAFTRRVRLPTACALTSRPPDGCQLSLAWPIRHAKAWYCVRIKWTT